MTHDVQRLADMAYGVSTSIKWRPNRLRWLQREERQQNSYCSGHVRSVAGLTCSTCNEQGRVQVKEMAGDSQEVTCNSVESAFVDQGYTGKHARNDAEEAGIELIIVKLSEAKRGLHFYRHVI